MTAPLDLPPCVFCEKMATEYPGCQYAIFEPLNPVTPGHVLVVHREHTTDASESPYLASVLMQAAAFYARQFDDVNIITSKGTHATQTVMHTHIHVVPRRESDGLPLPWTRSMSDCGP